MLAVSRPRLGRLKLVQTEPILRKRSASPQRPAVKSECAQLNLPRRPDFWVDRPRRLLGQGAFGRVYLTESKSGQLTVVKQVIAPHKQADFCREVRILELLQAEGMEQRCALVGFKAAFWAPLCSDSDCSEPNLQQLVPTIEMEYVQGVELFDILNQTYQAGVPLDVNAQVAILTALLEQLACLHAAGIVHRDVKMENILFDERLGRARLIDYGLACGVPRAAPAMVKCDAVAAAGTLGYLDPGALQALEKREKPTQTEAGDLWAVGLVAYQLRHLDGIGIASSQEALQVAKAAQANASNSALDAVIASLLQRQPELRPSALEALAALRK